MSMSLLGLLQARLAPAARQIVQPAASYSYAQLREDLAALGLRYPDTLRVGVIGETREGRELYAAVAGAPGARRHVLIQGAMHGREHMTAPLVMMQLERLLSRGVPAGFNFHMIPMANPDGVAISQTETGGALVDEIYRADIRSGYAGPPKRSALREWKANAAGVDLNRNFDAQWERVDTRPAPSAEGYRGPHPESEPETRALAAYTARFPFEATLSYHATGSEIYYEFGPPGPVNERSRSLAEAVNRLTRYTLTPDDGSSFGGYKDWAIEKRGIPSLTIEVGKEETPLPLGEYPDIWRRNRGVPWAVADWLARG